MKHPFKEGQRVFRIKYGRIGTVTNADFSSGQPMVWVKFDCIHKDDDPDHWTRYSFLRADDVELINDTA